MSEPENFLQRWSRRKHETSAGTNPAEKPAEATETAEAAPADTELPQADKPFDISQLPPVESIGAETDVSAFLKPGVPPELSHAALRRAWSSDPAIRDFVGLSENSWDFNDPTAMGGFGAIEPAEVARLLTQAMGAIADTEPQAAATTSEKGETPAGATASRSPPTPLPDKPSPPPCDDIDAAINAVDAATQKESDV